MGTFYPPDLLLAAGAGGISGFRLFDQDRLANNLFLKDRSSLPDQMSFVFTLPWARFVLTVGDRDRANKNEVTISVSSVATKDLSHNVLPTNLNRPYLTSGNGEHLFLMMPL
jgi:hypothetical protein